MSNKVKLILIILFFLLLISSIIMITYKTFFSKEQTKQVISEPIKIEKLKEDIQEITKNEEKVEDEEIIIVILNEKLEENVILPEEEVSEQETNAIQNQENNEETNNIQNENINNQEQESINQITEPTDFYIKVNYGANVVTIYSKDINGSYTVPYKAFICSTGTATPTSGIYNMDYKYRWLALFGNVYGQYATRITGNILFHSVPYLENENPGTLEYWEYDKLRNICFYGMYKINCRRC